MTDTFWNSLQQSLETSQSLHQPEDSMVRSILQDTPHNPKTMPRDYVIDVKIDCCGTWTCDLWISAPVSSSVQKGFNLNKTITGLWWLFWWVASRTFHSCSHAAEQSGITASWHTHTHTSVWGDSAGTRTHNLRLSRGWSSTCCWHHQLLVSQLNWI